MPAGKCKIMLSVYISTRSFQDVVRKLVDIMLS